VKTIGRHLIAEFYGCEAAVLDQVDELRRVMIRAAELVGATVLGETFHSFSPQGASGTVVIAESHLSVHTWPEKGYVAVDVYTCGGLDPRAAFDHLARAFQARSFRVQEILRGLPEDLENHGMLLPEDVQIITRAPRVELDRRRAAATEA